MRSVWAGGVALLLVVCGGGRPDEQKLSPDKLPKAVAQTVKERFPGAEITAASKEVEDGKTLYEVSLKHNGQKIDATLTADGKLQEIEKEIAAKKLPKAVTAALKAKFGKYTMQRAEEIIKVESGEEKLHAYEALIVADRQTLEVVVSPKGEITKVEKKGNAKEKDD
jgi:uncharacterized membrane protein YkoI